MNLLRERSSFSTHLIGSLAALSVAFGLVVDVPPVAAQSTPGASNAPRKITTVEGITEYALDNGLQVLLFPDQSKPTVTVNVTFRVGSRYEGRGETGMAHLLEHMDFKGTPTYKNIWGALEDHGASFNGTTWVDRTNYFETLPATDDNLDFALHMEADRMVNSTISGEEFAKEMTVVRNEFEMGENNPVGILSERMLSAAYLWHNYGKSTIGNRSDIERVPVENLRRFYKKYYQPDNATLVVAGKFDPAKTLGLITKYFGAIPRPKRVLEKTYTEEPTQDGPRLVTLERVGDVSAAGLVYHIPSGVHPDFPAIQVLEGVLTSRPSGRLYKALVEPGLAASVSGTAFSWAEPGVIQFMAEVRLDKDVHQVLDEMTRVVEGVAGADITTEEVERIKTRLLKGIKLSLTNSGRIGVRLSDAVARGDWRLFFIHRDRLKQVTLADVQRVAGKYLVESNRTAGLFLPTQSPTRAPIPPTPQIAEVVNGYTGSEQIAVGEAFVATPESIEHRVKRITLPSGIKVALLSKETRGDAVSASFRFRYGTEDSLNGHTTALGMLPSLMMRGTQKHEYQQLRDEIDRLQSQIFVGGGRRGGGGVGNTGASITTDRAHIVAAIELLGEIVKEPALAASEFETMKTEGLARFEQRLSDPRSRGTNAMGRALNPWPKDSIHYVPTLDEGLARLRAVTLSEIKTLYAKLYGAENLTVAVVGDFDADKVAATIEHVFGSWKSSSPYHRVETPFRPYRSDDLTILTPDKQMAIVGMGANFKMRDDDPDYPALTFANYILGQSFKSRLLNRLRHKGGLSYGAGSSLRADSEDVRASINATAICAPQNAVKAENAMREEVVRWIAQGVTSEELEEGKTSYALRFANRLANDRFVLGQLVRGLEIDRTFAYQAGLQKKIQTLTLADIKRALEKHLGSAGFVQMKAGDLEGAGAKADGDTAKAGETPPGQANRRGRNNRRRP